MVLMLAIISGSSGEPSTCTNWCHLKVKPAWREARLSVPGHLHSGRIDGRMN
jgi:hypothetical protein